MTVARQAVPRWPTIPVVVGWRVDLLFTAPNGGLELVGPYKGRKVTSRVVTSASFVDPLPPDRPLTDAFRGVSACTSADVLAAVLRDATANHLHLSAVLSRVELTTARQWPVKTRASCDGPGSWVARRMRRLAMYSTAPEAVRDRLRRRTGVPVIGLPRMPDRDEMAALMAYERPPGRYAVAAVVRG